MKAVRHSEKCQVAAQYWEILLKAEDARRCNCAALEEVLGLLPEAQRMVVGHTIQEAGINSACEDRVFRIDVGLSAGCGDGEPQVWTAFSRSKVEDVQQRSQETDAESYCIHRSRNSMPLKREYRIGHELWQISLKNPAAFSSSLRLYNLIFSGIVAPEDWVTMKRVQITWVQHESLRGLSG